MFLLISTTKFPSFGQIRQFKLVNFMDGISIVDILLKSEIMSNYIYENKNSKSFFNLAWISFAISFIGMGVGLIYLEAEISMKGFLAMSYLFSVTACFTLAKVVRDRHESDKFINKVESAKTEKFLNENTPLISSI